MDNVIYLLPVKVCPAFTQIIISNSYQHLYFDRTSTENFAVRQEKFKSSDPRVAQLASEIEKQDQLNRTIERARSIMESSSLSTDIMPDCVDIDIGTLNLTFDVKDTSEIKSTTSSPPTSCVQPEDTVHRFNNLIHSVDKRTIPSPAPSSLSNADVSEAVDDSRKQQPLLPVYYNSMSPVETSPQKPRRRIMTKTMSTDSSRDSSLMRQRSGSESRRKGKHSAETPTSDTVDSPRSRTKAPQGRGPVLRTSSLSPRLRNQKHQRHSAEGSSPEKHVSQDSSEDVLKPKTAGKSRRRCWPRSMSAAAAVSQKTATPTSSTSGCRVTGTSLVSPSPSRRRSASRLEALSQEMISGALSSQDISSTWRNIASPSYTLDEITPNPLADSVIKQEVTDAVSRCLVSPEGQGFLASPPSQDSLVNPAAEGDAGRKSVPAAGAPSQPAASSPSYLDRLRAASPDWTRMLPFLRER